MSELNTIEEAKAVLQGIKEKKVIEIFNSSTNMWSSSNNVQQYNQLPNLACYKYRVKPEAKMIPLDRGDIHIFKTILRPLDKGLNHFECGIVGTSEIHVYIYSGHITYQHLADLYEYSNDNGVTWKRCEKEGV